MKVMTPEEWFGSDDCKHPNLWLNIEDYVNYVLSIAAKKAKTTIEETSDDPYDHYIVVDKDSIINCLKN